MMRYLWCWLRFHRPRIESHWDMVGDPRFDGWNVYKCRKCGEWRDEE